MTDLAFAHAPNFLAGATPPEPAVPSSAVSQASSRVVRAAPLPPIAPTLRALLMHVGADVMKRLAINGKTPEQMAQDIGIDVDLVYSVLGGREADVGIRALDAIAKFVGGSLSVQIILPGETGS